MPTLHKGLTLAFFIAVVSIALILSSCGPSGAQDLPPGLTVEEHALIGAPTLDPLSFVPSEGSMDAILAAHAAERAETPTDNSGTVDGRFSMRATLGADQLIATESYGSGGWQGWVTVQKDGTEIFRTDTGIGSPITSLRGLWTFDGHWFLETAYISADSVMGRIFRDGVSLTEPLHYSDAFDFHLLAGRPFYFFMQGSQIGFSYDGHPVHPGYDEVPHYRCCSDSQLNPRKARSIVSFFARRAQTWYYVEVLAR